MKISTRGRYALRLMMDIAMHDSGEPVRIKDIARRQEVSEKYLEQIIAILNKAGFVRSIRGPKGGYTLSKKPEEYTAGMILRLTEGSLAPVACLDQEPNECERSAECVTLPVWEGLYKVITEYLDGITLQDIIDQQRTLIANDYII